VVILFSRGSCLSYITFLFRAPASEAKAIIVAQNSLVNTFFSKNIIISHPIYAIMIFPLICLLSDNKLLTCTMQDPSPIGCDDTYSCTRPLLTKTTSPHVDILIATLYYAYITMVQLECQYEATSFLSKAVGCNYMYHRSQ